MSDLPRGWDIVQTTAVGIENVLTIPAAQGVRRVLTAVNAQAVLEAAGTLQINTIFYQVSAVNNTLGYTTSGDSTAAAFFVGTFNWTGTIMSPVGAGLLVAFTAGAANVVQTLEAQGYDL